MVVLRMQPKTESDESCGRRIQESLIRGCDTREEERNGRHQARATGLYTFTSGVTSVKTKDRQNIAVARVHRFVDSSSFQRTVQAVAKRDTPVIAASPQRSVIPPTENIFFLSKKAERRPGVLQTVVPRPYRTQVFDFISKSECSSCTAYPRRGLSQGAQALVVVRARRRKCAYHARDRFWSAHLLMRIGQHARNFGVLLGYVYFVVYWTPTKRTDPQFRHASLTYGWVMRVVLSRNQFGKVCIHTDGTFVRRQRPVNKLLRFQIRRSKIYKNYLFDCFFR